MRPIDDLPPAGVLRMGRPQRDAYHSTETGSRSNLCHPKLSRFQSFP